MFQPVFTLGFGVGSGLLVAAATADIVVDDFTQGPGFVGAGGPGYFHHTDENLDPAHTLGGRRDFAVQACLHPAFGTLPIEHDPATGTIAVGGTDVSQWCEGVIFDYGWRYGVDDSQLNLDLAGAGVTHLEIDLLAFDRGEPVLPGNPGYYSGALTFATTYTRTTISGSTYETYDARDMDFMLPESDGTTTFRVPLEPALFTAVGEYDPSDVDAIYLYTGGAEPGAHLVVDAIRFVGPEVLLAGDHNGDGFVAQGDLDLVLLNWGDAVAPAGWTSPTPFDGAVSQNELDEVLLNWGAGTPTSAVVIPEPAAGGVLLAVLGFSVRRRQRD